MEEHFSPSLKYITIKSIMLGHCRSMLSPKSVSSHCYMYGTSLTWQTPTVPDPGPGLR